MDRTSTSSAHDRAEDIRLSVRQLAVHFGDRSALDGVSLDFARSEIVGLVGPNGAGKSTLLRVLAGLLEPSHGTVHRAEDERGATRTNIVYVPQRGDASWSFPISVLDVALMGRARDSSRLRRFSRSDRQRAMEALARVGMDHSANVQIGELSGGQQQRVLLARALVQDGNTYLLDEPFTGIDLPTQRLLIEIFSTLRDSGSTIIYATHDIEQAECASDRIALLNRRVVAVGPPADVMTGDNLRAAFGGHLEVSPASNVASAPR